MGAQVLKIPVSAEIDMKFLFCGVCMICMVNIHFSDNIQQLSAKTAS